jgi:hypothetical protein
MMQYIVVVTGPEQIHPYPEYLSERGGLTSNLDTQIDPDDPEHCFGGARRFGSESEAMAELAYARTLRPRNPVYGDASFQVLAVAGPTESERSA